MISNRSPWRLALSFLVFIARRTVDAEHFVSRAISYGV
jgi:hypothetical protein